MWTLQIEFKLYGKLTDRPEDQVKPIQGILTLDFLAPFIMYPTMKTFKPPPNTPFGHWTSPSQYLGKERGGKYYLTNLNFFYTEGAVHDPNVINPVGLFFDSTSDAEPFLTLYDFRPTDTSVRRERAVGVLDNRAPIPTRHTWVEWYPIILNP